MLDQINDTVGVSVFVIIPGEKENCKQTADKNVNKLSKNKSYQDTNFTKVLESMMPALASKIELWSSPTKSVETTWSSV